ncbi:hypothetical protein [Actinomadura gamaensis]|uniref:Uncharacterized protein n=1 Tax=Actinomadura gamaensis TaxID=1763541 RepID=A0ABV9TQV9_9ACTN
MGFDHGRHTVIAADRPLPSNQRRAFLEVLHQVIKETQAGVTSTLVLRSGCQVLFVFDTDNPVRSAEVGCDFDRAAGWCFVWTADGGTLGPVQDVRAIAASIATALGARSESKGRG